MTLTTKNNDKKRMTPEERKASVKTLRVEHEYYFKESNNENAIYIPKMAYRPTGKDELHVTFFPSELENNKDIYTEFVSIDYETEDPKRTLYLLKYNPHWKEEYEMITSNSGFKRHMVAVGELKVINDVTDRRDNIEESYPNSFEKLATDNYKIPNPETERDIVDVLKGIEKALLSINQKLK